MFGRVPDGFRKCPLCRGSKTETYYAEERIGGATRETRRVKKTRACPGCGGLGHVCR